MTIIATLSELRQTHGVTVATITLHTARSGRPCGEFLVLRYPDGRTDYRGVDDAQITPDGDFSDVAASVRRQYFQRAYARSRDLYHGKAA